MSPPLIDLFIQSFIETLLMVAASGVAGALAGVPLGILLHLTDKNGVLPAPGLHRALGMSVNAARSTPFIILLVASIPLAHVFAGPSPGVAAIIIPLTIASAPFIARLVAAALREVDPGLVEAARAMGASTWQIVCKVLVPEAFPDIVAGLTMALVSLVGYSVLAGAIGGAGLGDLGIRYGYQQFLPEVMLLVAVVLVAFAQSMQMLGDALVRHLRQ